MNILKTVFVIFLVALTPLWPSEYTERLRGGLLLLNMGQAGEALAIFKEASGMAPEESAPHYYVAEAYFTDGNIEEAIASYQRAIEMDPENNRYHYSLALAYVARGDKPEAIESLSKAVESGPQTIIGRYARKLKADIESEAAVREVIAKWTEIEKARRAEGVRVAVDRDDVDAAVKATVEQIIDRIRFGFTDVRLRSSMALIGYESEELLRVMGDILELLDEEEDDVRENLVFALGKSKAPEAFEKLSILMRNDKESFPIRLSSLWSIVNFENNMTQPVMRDVLDGMVKARISERDEAESNIEARRHDIDGLESRKAVLSGEIMELNSKIEENRMKLGAGGFGGDPYMQPVDPYMQPMSPYGAGPEPMLQEQLTPTERRAVREELERQQESSSKKREEVSEIDKKITDLNQQISRYEFLLVRRTRDIPINIQIRTIKEARELVKMETRPETAAPLTAPRMGAPPFGGAGQQDMFGPPEMQGQAYQPFMDPGYPGAGQPPGMMRSPAMGGRGAFTAQRAVETDTERSEMVMAITLINFLGETRDKEGLSVIRKGWDEFGVNDENYYYYLTLARLGDYGEINRLAERLRENYPAERLESEIMLRSEIVKVLGEYLKNVENNQLFGLIKFLSTEGLYPEIRLSASNALSVARAD